MAQAETIRVEAESYTAAYDVDVGNNAGSPANCTYGGLDVDVNDTADTGGGCKVGWTVNGEWLDYAINPAQAGKYRITYRYSSGAAVLDWAGQILFKQGGTTLSTVDLWGTGDWEVFWESTAVVDLAAGAQTIRLEFNSPVFDLNWLELELKTVYVTDDSEYRIEIEDYNDAYDAEFNNLSTDNGGTLTHCPYYYIGVDVSDITDNGNSCGIGYINSGEWLEYSINVTQAADYTVKYRHASGTGGPGTGGDILFKVDGSTAKTTTISNVTGDWNVYASSADTVALTPGEHTIRLEFSNPYLNMNWFSLEKVPPPAIAIPNTGVTQIEFENYVAAYDTTGGNSFTAPTSCDYGGSDVDVGNFGGSDCEVGYVDNGEWLEYLVDVAEAGDYTLIYRYGSPNNSPGQIQFNIDGSAVKTTTLTTNTGGYSTYASQTDTVTLPAGQHTIRTQFVNPILNVNWFSLEKIASPVITIASSGVTEIGFDEYVSAYDTTAGNETGTSPSNCTYNGFDVDVFDSVTVPGDCAIGYVAHGETLDYDVNVIEAGDYTLTYRVAAEGSNPPGSIILKVDGSTVLTTTLSTTTGDWGVYASETDTVTLPAGLHTITIEFSNPWFNGNWFSFEKAVAPSGPSSCSFPGVAASASDGGQITINGGGVIYEAPNNQVVTKNITSDANGCGSGIPCTKTDTVAPVFTDVPAFPAGADVTVNYGDTYNFTPGAYNTVFVNSTATLNFAPGDYTFATSLAINSDVTLNVSSPGLVRLFVNSSLQVNSNSTLNMSGGATEFLMIYAANDLTFLSGVTGRLIGYSGGNIDIQNGADITGALTAVNNMTVQFGANLRYDASYIENGGFSEACGFSAPSTQCEAIFPDGASNASASGSLIFAANTSIQNSPDNIMATANAITDYGTDTCHTEDCSISNSYVETITTPTFNGGVQTLVAKNGTGSLSPGHYAGVTVRAGGILYLDAPGDYYFTGDFDLNDNAQLILSNEGTARVWVNSSIYIASNGLLNPSPGATKNLVMFSTGIINASGFVVATRTVLYAKGNITLQQDSSVTGAVTSEADISLNQSNVRFIYDNAVVQAIDYTGMSCDIPVVTANLIAEWRFDEAGWDGTAAEVSDNSGNSLHGVAVSDGGFPDTSIASPALAGDPGTCSYGEFDLGNNGYVTVTDPGAGSALDVTELTLSMWVYPNAYPPATLATLISKNTHFEAHITTTGQVIFEWFSDGIWQGVTSSATLPLNQWSHVAVTFEAGEQKIYIDGALSTSDTNANVLIPNDDPIAIGYDLNPTNRALDGHIDEIRLYGAKLTASEVAIIATETHACVLYDTPNHIDISVSSTASTCAPETVTFTVNNVNSDPLTDYTGTLTLSTSTGNGDWSKTGTAADAYGTLNAGASDSGAATYTFDASDNGTVTLQLATGRTESLTISAVDSEAGATGTSGSVAYSTNGFVRTDLTGGTQIVGYPQVWQIQMKQQDPITGDCATNTDYAQVGVKVWLDRSAADPNGTAPTFVDAVSGDSVSVPSSEPGSNNFDLTFVNGVAQFTANTTDVGMYNFYVADKTRSFADVDLITESGVKIHGPFGYYVSVVSNPAATTAAGAAFLAAGEIFRVNVAAVAWQAEDDADDNKVPDGHDAAGNASRANLANNPVIASFGQETPAESITLSSGLLLPAGGIDSGLKDEDTLSALARTVDNFSSGSGFIERVYFDEVGIIEIKAEVTDGEYMGKNAGFTLKSQSYSANVGRFTPANFTFASGALTAACQTGLDYSYMGQSFTGQFAISPKSSRGSSVQNYTGAFVKLVTGDFDFFARDINTGAALTPRLSSGATALTWSGDGTVDASFTLTRAASPDGPYTTLAIGTDFDDSDGIGLAAASKDLDSDGDTTNDSAELDQTEVRFGRLRLGNAHGPETALLSVPLVTEYWASPSWLQNEDDSCTTVARSAITYPSGIITTPGNRTVTVGGGTTEGSYGSIVGDAVSFVAGDASHSFSAPGTGNTGNFKTSIDLTAYPWLHFDWNGDGDYSDTAPPDNQINFGIYRSHDRMLYWREY